MDSISQAALGAAIGAAVMGKRRPFWHGALAGAAIGTLPDLDVLIDHGDAVRNMVLHRAETHAWFWQALASPAIALLLTLVGRDRALFGRWWLLTLLVLFTHSALDAVTVYGTRLALPFNDHPYALGSLFIIDPLYSLPLLLGLALSARGSGAQSLRWNHAGLTLSSVYLLWAVAVQHQVTASAVAAAEAQGLNTRQMLVVPTPFNTLIWRILVVHDGATYAEGFYSLLDPLIDPQAAIRFDRFTRDAELDRLSADSATAEHIRRFSQGFYALARQDQYWVITDLRMGQEPHYVFAFAFAETLDGEVQAIDPLLRRQRLDLTLGMGWLGQRLFTPGLPPPR